MKKIGIVYESLHKGNTRKVLNALKEAYPEMELITTEELDQITLETYDVVGFASGIYAGRFEKRVVEALEKAMEEAALKNVFFIYTSSNGKFPYAKKMEKKGKEEGLNILGTYGCKGFNTFGPFKLVGGVSKDHPNQEDLDKAVAFCKDKGVV